MIDNYDNNDDDGFFFFITTIPLFFLFLLLFIIWLITFISFFVFVLLFFVQLFSYFFFLSTQFIYIESHLTRKAPPSYSDGVYMMAGEDRPSPRELSQALMKGDDGVASSRNLTALFAFFGKFKKNFLAFFIYNIIIHKELDIIL